MWSLTKPILSYYAELYINKVLSVSLNERKDEVIGLEFINCFAVLKYSYTVYRYMYCHCGIQNST